MTVGAMRFSSTPRTTPYRAWVYFSLPSFVHSVWTAWCIYPLSFLFFLYLCICTMIDDVSICRS